MSSSSEGREDWTDEQWLAWLAEGDAAERDADSAASGEPSVPPEQEQRRPPALSTQMMTAAMTGLAEAIYGPREKPAIVVDASGDPPGDDGLELHLDLDHPEHSVVVVRPERLRPPGSGRPNGDV